MKLPLIPTKTDDETLQRYVDNIKRAYLSASTEQRERGWHWYETAHDLAYILGEGDVRTGAGLIAALSVQKMWWTENVRLAVDASQGDVHGHTPDNLRKVARILDGEDPESVLPMSAKTGHFFRNILDPRDPDPVTIDRHAHDVAVGRIYGAQDRGLGNATRYATLAHAYRVAARELGIIPSVLQACTWVAQVDSVDGTGTRAPRWGK